uniref:Uncharacterized protein n=1 Tax=Timema shepardi TaxID=629360 RepID=A0A7R9B972_TIMSH|nr:unnamed protein product [Timema shepardi]
MLYSHIVTGRNCTSPDEFLCPSGRCIRRANVCDSQCDCAPAPTTSRGGSSGACADEMECKEYYTDVHGVRLCDSSNTLTCIVPGQNRDKDRCIHPQYLCDKTNDCQNGHYLSDEFGCRKRRCL